jgi:hypothetical protein
MWFPASKRSRGKGNDFDAPVNRNLTEFGQMGGKRPEPDGTFI